MAFDPADLAALPDPLTVEPPSSPPRGQVAIPGSKSITNRALVAAALAEGTSELVGPLRADDSEAMVGCLRALGVRIDDADDDVWTVVGRSGVLATATAPVDARLSGTTARFVLPLLALGPGPVTLDGAAPLRARPMADGIAAVRALGAEVDDGTDPGHLPVVVRGGRGRDAGADAVAVRGDASSQFLSGLLLAGPARPGGLRLQVDGPLVSRSYVELTAAVMAAFGAEVSWLGDDGLAVAGGGYRATRYEVEPDASAASYLLAAAAMVPGARLRVTGVGAALQGDWGFADLLARMGADVVREPDAIEVRGGAPLRGITADLSDLSDVAQTLAVVAAVAHGPTEITGIGFIRHKETDRIGNVVAELRRCGVDAEERPDGYVVRPAPLRPAVVQTYDDHRMAMSFALLGLRTPGIAIADPACVAKTFPGYWATLAGLGVGLR
ncbi:MAG: 3-phosphoshikimate 1-carboxyvinyltransferase [Acidimicrobiales bacterium]